MSRLTNPDKPFKVACRGSQCVEVKRLYDRLVEYEDIGEPSELRKVTFCRDCEKWNGKKFGNCDKYDVIRNPDDFCSRGEPREERENEV